MSKLGLGPESMARQVDMFGPPPEDVEQSDTSSDSYCTPPEACECIHRAAGGRPDFDPWTNRYAIAHGWLRARMAWTVENRHTPGTMRKDGTLDISDDPMPWPLVRGEYVHGNPPYSNPLPYVLRFILEMERCRTWGMLLLKSDSRTSWSAALLDRRQPIVHWKGAMSFYLAGQRVVGNNFASTFYVVDGTGTDPQTRYNQLVPAFGDLGWCYR